MEFGKLETAIENCFKKTAWMNRQSKNPYAKELCENGIVIIEDFLSTEDCENYYNTIKNIMKENENDENGLNKVDDSILVNRGKKFDSDYNMIDIFDIDSLVPDLKKLKEDDFVINIINEVNSMALKMQNLNIYYTKGCKPRCLHVDNFEISQFKAFIYLTDVNTMEDGPHMYVKKSHLCSSKKILSYIDNYKNSAYSTDMNRFSYNDALACLAKKGTLIITDQNGVHGSYPQNADHERMLIMMNFCKARINP